MEKSNKKMVTFSRRAKKMKKGEKKTGKRREKSDKKT